MEVLVVILGLVLILVILAVAVAQVIESVMIVIILGKVLSTKFFVWFVKVGKGGFFPKNSVLVFKHKFKDS